MGCVLFLMLISGGHFSFFLGLAAVYLVTSSPISFLFSGLGIGA